AYAQRQPTRSPHGPLNIPCENCHTATSWAPIRAVPEFNHDSTGYPLRGMHEKVYCTQCHIKPVFSEVGKNCADCHADIHRRQMGANCAECHTPLGWNVSVKAIQNHFNRFPLLGAHAVVQCEECHKNAAAGIYIGLSTTCVSCHLADFQKSVNRNHVSA
ncbi:MAG: cytochrome c3 family protein, partial [Candidatus Acidiferrales bacterium]